ncbi:MAG: Crp/Fnr family transcriptional regulator [Gemmatimonadaceae bacterium]|nr:Crp/Fnr family transcriptional regulator [Gemmatimonadaceae bacterium]
MSEHAQSGVTTGQLSDSSADGSTGSNRLLTILATRAPAEHDALLAQLEPLAMKPGDVIFDVDGPIPYVYFPVSCVASLVKQLSDGRKLEVGTTGSEGFVGLPAFLGATSVPIQCFVQVPGSALRLRSEALRAAAASGTELHRILQRYAQYLFDQAAQSLACNRLHQVEQRCVRWLLMTHDRVPGDTFELTQEFLSFMLGVRRASVSEAAEALQVNGLIRYARGRITIVNRAGLEAAGCECYASDRADYERLLPLDW